MCIIHDSSIHHIFQNMMEAFEKSKIVSVLFMKRIGYLLCTCYTEIYFDSQSIVATQRSLYKWFDEAIKDSTKEVSLEKLGYFKAIVEDLKKNGAVDSGTKIAFMKLIKDLDSHNYSKLRYSKLRYSKLPNKKYTSTEGYKPMFYSKLVKIKFDLNLCSAKEFCELINKIDNCAIKYIEKINECRIVIRDVSTLSIRHFMGEIDATLEASNENHLYSAELSLKRLADAVHYRLAKQIPSCDTITSNCSYSSLKVLIQSPPRSLSTSLHSH